MWALIGLTLEEIDSLVGNQITSQILRRIHTANDQCAVAISALPQFNKTGLLHGLFQINGTTHHGYLILGVIVCTAAAKALDSLLCLIQPALSYEPPRRLRCQEQEDSERSWEHPLECDGNSDTTVSIRVSNGRHQYEHTCKQRRRPWTGSDK